MKLNKSQLKVLSEFCNDTAKGLMLAALLGQGFVSGTTFSVRI